MRVLRAICLSAWLSCLAASNGGAAPPGINLSWNDCGSFGQDTRVFACDTNVGSHTLVGSYVSPVALDSLDGVESQLYLQSAAASVPPWWQIRNYNDNTVGCRGGATPAGSTNFNFANGPFNCHDFWQGQAIGGWALIQNFGGPNRQRILVAAAIEFARPLEAELETYSFKLVISNSKTVGANACAGCMEQADIVFTSSTLYLPNNYPNPSRDVLLTQPSTRNYVYWRPGVVATRNVSWGAIKSMYR